MRIERRATSQFETSAIHCTEAGDPVAGTLDISIQKPTDLSQDRSDGHFTLEPEQNIFPSLVADLTHRCNMACANCYIPNRAIPDMDKKKLFAFASRLPSRVLFRLIGAEPTLRSDLAEIISTLKVLGHKVSLTTNGLKLADPEYLHALKDAGLRMVLISMNGADDDSLYEKLDNGRYAGLKTAAFANAIRARMFVNTGTIISRGLNESAIQKQFEYVMRTLEDQKVQLSPKIGVVLRFKSIGFLGRNQGHAHSYPIDELIELVGRELKIDSDLIRSSPGIGGVNPAITARQNVHGFDFNQKSPSCYIGEKLTRWGPIWIRIIDWSPKPSPSAESQSSLVSEGIPDAGNRNRGRITSDWKVAPFFEDVKKNEFGY